MRLLGIDFGTKKVGLALSDEEGSMAFPLTVLPADQNLLSAVAAIVKENEVQEVVIGESRNFKGEENPLMQHIHQFKNTLEDQYNVTIHFEPEVLSSQEAKRIQGNVAELDASAAAIILQSYLDRQQHG